MIRITSKANRCDPVAYLAHADELEDATADGCSERAVWMRRIGWTLLAVQQALRVRGKTVREVDGVRMTVKVCEQRADVTVKLPGQRFGVLSYFQTRRNNDPHYVSRKVLDYFREALRQATT